MINVKKFKLGFGPMSQDIVRIISDYTINHKYPLMLIASRNQIDYDSGYVCKTSELIQQLTNLNNPNLLVCRDHCGPYFSDLDSGLSLEESIIRCKNTIKSDIQLGFDLIHIDVSKIKIDQLSYGKILIEYALDLNPNIMLEFGSEDNTGIDLNSSIGRIEDQLNFLQQYKNNVKFFVTQTGSLTKNGQIGKFDVEANTKIAKQIHDAGFLFKEHNADYFNLDQILNRKQAGVDSLNIAPQLGKIQTLTLKAFAPTELWGDFSRVVYKANKWQRWVDITTTASMDIATEVSGHYCFNTLEYSNIIQSIDAHAFKDALENNIKSILNHYRLFD
jgi:hypothetical protein